MCDDGVSLAPHGLLVEDVKFFSQSFFQLLYSHTKREDTSVAHSLATYTSNILDFSEWTEDVSPQFFFLVIQADLVALC